MPSDELINQLLGYHQDAWITGGLIPRIPGGRKQEPKPAPAETEPNYTIIVDSNGNQLWMSRQGEAAPGLVPFSLPGSFAPLVISSSHSKKLEEDEQDFYSFTGADMRVLIEPVYQPGPRVVKQLIELQTLTVSIHREKSPVRAIGYINPKGFARGRRTIAGTMVLTQFTVDVLYRFLTRGIDPLDLSSDSRTVKVDQLPPFHMTLLFADEYGHASYRRLIGVDILTDGTVYSVHDMMTEQTLTYTALDFTPLLPLTETALLDPVQTIQPGKTPKDVGLDLIARI